jgi:hypothetical protein
MSAMNNIMGSIPPSVLSDMYLSLVTNEEDTRALQTLAERPITGNAVMGVSGMCLLNMASIRGSSAPAGAQIEHIILFDDSRRVQSFWQQMEPLLKSATDRLDALAKIKDLLLQRGTEYCCLNSSYPPTQYLANLRRLEEEVALGKSYLSTDERFEKIQKIFISNHFYFAPLDLFDSEKFGELHRELGSRNITVDTMYISNILRIEKTKSRLSLSERLNQCMKSLSEILADSSQVVYGVYYDNSELDRPAPTNKIEQQVKSFSDVKNNPNTLHANLRPPLLEGAKG